MRDALVWLYVLNATLLLVHEIDAAYWKEWRLVHLLIRPSGGGVEDRAGHREFVLLHLPLVLLVLVGLLRVVADGLVGLVFSLGLAVSGITAFCVHVWWERQGRREFSWPVSQFVLGAILPVSVVQLTLTVLALGG